MEGCNGCPISKLPCGVRCNNDMDVRVLRTGQSHCKQTRSSRVAEVWIIGSQGDKVKVRACTTRNLDATLNYMGKREITWARAFVKFVLSEKGMHGGPSDIISSFLFGENKSKTKVSEALVMATRDGVTLGFWTVIVAEGDGKLVLCDPDDRNLCYMNDKVLLLDDGPFAGGWLCLNQVFPYLSNAPFTSSRKCIA